MNQQKNILPTKYLISNIMSLSLCISTVFHFWKPHQIKDLDSCSQLGIFREISYDIKMLWEDTAAVEKNGCNEKKYSYQILI